MDDILEWVDSTAEVLNVEAKARKGSAKASMTAKVMLIETISSML